MAGLLDIDMTTPEGQGFNSALMQAAAALLTPRHRGGGMGAAFAAFPQAIDRAQQQAQRARLLGLQEQQMGLQTAEAQRKAQAQAAQHQNLMRLIAGLPPEQQAAAMVAPEKFAEAQLPQAPKLETIFGPDGQPQKAWVRGPGADPVPVGGSQRPAMPWEYELGPDGQPRMRPGVLAAKTQVGKAGASSISNVIMPATPGQEAADKKYAADFVDFATGGYADAMKQIEQLREASSALGSGAAISGPFMGNLPDSVLAVTNPKAVSTKEDIQEVAQRNLRLILGAQFTEKEGERLIARVFNPRLSEEENKKRADRLIRQMESAAAAKLDAAQYFQQHGSLTGWQGKLPRLSDFDPDFGKKDDVPGKRLVYNPQTGQLE